MTDLELTNLKKKTTMNQEQFNRIANALFVVASLIALTYSAYLLQLYLDR